MIYQKFKSNEKYINFLETAEQNSLDQILLKVDSREKKARILDRLEGVMNFLMESDTLLLDINQEMPLFRLLNTLQLGVDIPHELQDVDILLTHISCV